MQNYRLDIFSDSDRYIYIYYFDVVILLCCQREFLVIVLLGMNVFLNIKIINKNYRFSKHYILETCNRHLIELIFKPVLMCLNVFSY